MASYIFITSLLTHDGQMKNEYTQPGLGIYHIKCITNIKNNLSFADGCVYFLLTLLNSYLIASDISTYISSIILSFVYSRNCTIRYNE